MTFTAWQRIEYLTAQRNWESPGGWRNVSRPGRFLYQTASGRYTIMLEGYRRLRSVNPTSVIAAVSADDAREGK